MEFTYTIESYHVYESRLFVVYTPVDTAFEALGSWVQIQPTYTQDEILDAVVEQAPYRQWGAKQSAVAASLAGTSGSGAKPIAKPKSQEDRRAEAKAARAGAVAAITVTTAAGNTFDGDETSQNRMARAVIALSAAGAGATVKWVLANNTAIQATAAELTEALALAGAAQAALWVINI